MGVHVPIASEALGAALCTSQIIKFLFYIYFAAMIMDSS